MPVVWRSYGGLVEVLWYSYGIFITPLWRLMVRYMIRVRVLIIGGFYFRETIFCVVSINFDIDIGVSTYYPIFAKPSNP